MCPQLTLLLVGGCPCHCPSSGHLSVWHCMAQGGVAGGRLRACLEPVPTPLSPNNGSLPPSLPLLPACSPSLSAFLCLPREGLGHLWQCHVFCRCLGTGLLGRLFSPCWCSPSLSRLVSPLLSQSLTAGLFQGSWMHSKIL